MALMGPEVTQSLQLTAITPLGERAWRCLSAAGEDVVLKIGAGAGPAPVDLLRTLPHLYPPFRYPRVLDAEPGAYLLYPFIPGVPLSTAGDLDPAVHGRVYELAGRMAAVFRSLPLAGMFRTLTGRLHERELAGEAAGGRRALLPTGLGAQDGGLAQRRREAVQSYDWTREVVRRAGEVLTASGEIPARLWSEWRGRVEDTTSIHFAPGVTLLAHTAFTPEHLLLCPDGELAVVGWRLSPRPYNYMRLSYLAWRLVHSPGAGLMGRARELLTQVPAVGYTAAADLSLGCALLESWVEAGEDIPARQAKLEALLTFMEETVASGLGEESGAT